MFVSVVLLSPEKESAGPLPGTSFKENLKTAPEETVDSGAVLWLVGEIPEMPVGMGRRIVD